MATYYSGYSPTIDWSEIGRSDPVPGDADQIRAMAKEFRDTAAALQTAKDKLEQIKNDQSADSDAVTEFKSMSGDTGDSIYRAHGRYTTVASALETYAGDLEGVQSRAVTALNKALQTKEDKTNAETTRDGITSEEDQDGTQFAAAERNVTSLSWQESDDRRALDSIHNDWISAGHRAASSIDGSFDDGLTPDPWEKFWQMASEILDTLSTVLSIAALVLAWVPFLGQALAALALVVAALNLITKLVLAVGYGGDWGAVAWAAVGVIGGAFTKSLGAIAKTGSVALRGTKLTKAAAAATRAGKGGAGAARSATSVASKSGVSKGVAEATESAQKYAAGLRDIKGTLKDGFQKYFKDFATQAEKVKADGFINTARNNLDGLRDLGLPFSRDIRNLGDLLKNPTLKSELLQAAGKKGTIVLFGSVGLQFVLTTKTMSGMAERGPSIGETLFGSDNAITAWQDALSEEAYNNAR